MPAALTIRLDDATLGALDRIAEKTERSRDGLVIQAIEDFVAFDDWATARIVLGLAAAEESDFASPDELARVRAKFH